MWRKPESKPAQTVGGPSVASPPAKQSRPPGEASISSHPPITPAVSKGIKIKGDITGHGDLSVDGEVEGNVHLSPGTFTVGPEARVTGDIEAREVIIRGEVIGALKACERVHIWSTGRLTGDMETRGIVIEDGAILHSRVAVPRAEAHEAAATPAETGQPSLQKAKAIGA